MSVSGFGAGSRSVLSVSLSLREALSAAPLPGAFPPHHSNHPSLEKDVSHEELARVYVSVQGTHSFLQHQSPRAIRKSWVAWSDDASKPGPWDLQAWLKIVNQLTCSTSHIACDHPQWTSCLKFPSQKKQSSPSGTRFKCLGRKKEKQTKNVQKECFSFKHDVWVKSIV
jgi:hypothetical protein